jgi:hypothetical protein
VDEKQQPHQGALLCFVKEKDNHQRSAKPTMCMNAVPAMMPLTPKADTNTQVAPSFMIKFTPRR